MYPLDMGNSGDICYIFSGDCNKWIELVDDGLNRKCLALPAIVFRCRQNSLFLTMCWRAVTMSRFALLTRVVFIHNI